VFNKQVKKKIIWLTKLKISFFLKKKKNLFWLLLILLAINFNVLIFISGGYWSLRSLSLPLWWWLQRWWWWRRRRRIFRRWSPRWSRIWRTYRREGSVWMAYTSPSWTPINYITPCYKCYFLKPKIFLIFCYVFEIKKIRILLFDKEFCCLFIYITSLHLYMWHQVNLCHTQKLLNPCYKNYT
jgi:hypothetical protein